MKLSNFEILEDLINHGPALFIVSQSERSPLICMAWLVKKYSMSINESLIYLMNVHKKTNPLNK